MSFFGWLLLSLKPRTSLANFYKDVFSSCICIFVLFRAIVLGRSPGDTFLKSFCYIWHKYYFKKLLTRKMFTIYNFTSILWLWWMLVTCDGMDAPIHHSLPLICRDLCKTSSLKYASMFSDKSNIPFFSLFDKLKMYSGRIFPNNSEGNCN